MSIIEPKIVPFFWYNGKAEEAANFYVSVFQGNSYIESVRPPVVTFVLHGRTFAAVDGGGSDYEFTPGTSLQVLCEDQAEVDRLWEAFGERTGGTYLRAGWLHDQFGLSWQIVPRKLSNLLQDPDREKSERTMKAMLRMAKLDIAALQAAHDGVQE